MFNSPSHQENIMTLEDFIIAGFCCVEQIWQKEPHSFSLAVCLKRKLGRASLPFSGLITA